MQCLVTAINAYGTDFAYSAASAVVAATGPPTDITLPVISGTPVVGNMLTSSNGTWTGSDRASLISVLPEADSSAISGADGLHHTLQAADVGLAARMHRHGN